MSDAGGDVANPGPDDGTLRATVDLALMAHHVRPGESLAVRLVGTVGPDGSWALDEVAVRREPDRIVLEPRLRRVQGDMFIQMVIPLDHTVKLTLPPGAHRIVVLQHGAALVDTVVVSSETRRTPPVVELPPADAARTVVMPQETVVSLPCTARVADGWIDRIEVRDRARGQEGPWHAPEMVQRVENGAVRATLTVRRPAGDPARRVEVRAIDGQGDVSAVASVQLPAL